MDTLDDILDIGIGLAFPDDIPEPTPDEMRAIVHLLPADFGKTITTVPPKTPAQSSLTCYSEKISIRIPHDVLASLKKEAKARGFSYQTFINLILSEYAAGRLNI